MPRYVKPGSLEARPPVGPGVRSAPRRRLAERLLVKRLAGWRRGLLEAAASEAAPLAGSAVPAGRWPGLAGAARRGLPVANRARWLCTRSYHRGDPVFAEAALACAYEDELSDKQGRGSALAELAGRLFQTSQASEVVGGWGLGPGSTSEELTEALAQAAQATWCLPGGPSKPRVAGFAIFAFSGMLQHSHEPALALTFVGDVCLAVAARDLSEGDEFTACLMPWRFLDAYEDENPACWPRALPPRDGAQMSVVLRDLGRFELAAWEGDEVAQCEAALKSKAWLDEFGGKLPLLQKAPYLLLRAHALVLHLCTGTHNLDEALDAAAAVRDMSSHLPMSEVTELCVHIALLGAALAHVKKQPERAKELFSHGDELLSNALGGETDVWGPWLRTFVPPPLLDDALAAWGGMDEPIKLNPQPPQVSQMPVPSQLAQALRMPSSTSQEEQVDKIVDKERAMGRALADMLSEQMESEKPSAQQEVFPDRRSPDGEWTTRRLLDTPLGGTEVVQRLGALVVTLDMVTGIDMGCVAVEVETCSVKFALLTSEGEPTSTSAVVDLGQEVDAAAAEPAKLQRKQRRLVLRLPLKSKRCDGSR
eukprot:gnl/TRDRNA2_/TRDRNA2_189469_c0_seq1.p1 gnl/TRDRNA2_/TRDRNA2_189469_c0~~gnl/TRDRNA2_/TRDRNA2_189469_c0_seq1.p1  ORF type:complete len:593 (-),score=108.66 gnl/TRDRNA2_/TRDRNA2_189469_c0_seq1:131-1909(-)